MDFREQSENVDFSIGCSDEWSAKESAEDSSCTSKPRKHEMTKKKTNHEKKVLDI